MKRYGNGDTPSDDLQKLFDVDAYDVCRLAYLFDLSEPVAEGRGPAWGRLRA